MKPISGKDENVFRINLFVKKYKEIITILTGLAVYGLSAYLFHLPCPIKFFTGVSCPGCGMTRSLFAVCRLDFAAAIYYHPLIFYVIVLVPVLIVIHVRNAVQARKVVIVISSVLFIGVYLYRVAILHSPVLEVAPQNGVMIRLILWIKSLL